MDSIKKYCRNSIGKVIATNEGYDLEVIDGGSKIGYVTAKIRNYIFEVQMSHVKTGEVKYPYHQSVFNVGYIGVGKYSKKSDKLAYQKWSHMLERCYSHKCQKKHPTYIGCSVDKRWHNFQVFAKWFYKYYPKDGLKYELDKDIRVEDNKIYSSYTCMFVPKRVNKFMTNIQSANTSGYTGVSWDKEKSKWKASISIDGKNKHLGYFKCIKTASRIYQKAREKEAEKLRAYYSFDYTKEILDNIR